MLDSLNSLSISTLPALIADAAVADSAAVAGETVERLFSIQGFFTLGMLVLLQAVLGFDNLLYISIESKRVAEDKQSYVAGSALG